MLDPENPGKRREILSGQTPEGWCWGKPRGKGFGTLGFNGIGIGSFREKALGVWFLNGIGVGSFKEKALGVWFLMGLGLAPSGLSHKG